MYVEILTFVCYHQQMKNSQKCVVMVGFGAILLLGYGAANRGGSISSNEVAVIQAFIDQSGGKTASGSIKVRPEVYPLLFSPRPFSELDPATKSAAEAANSSWKPAESVPVARLDRVTSFRKVSFSQDNDDCYTFERPIIVDSQALLGYAYVQDNVATNHQVLLLRDGDSWRLKEDRRI